MLDCQDHEVCIESAMREAELICQEKGLRFTELRREVLRCQRHLGHMPKEQVARGLADAGAKPEVID